MRIWVIFLLLMSLMKNKLEWLSFFVSQLSLNLITPSDHFGIQKLQNLIRVFLFIIFKRYFLFI